MLTFETGAPLSGSFYLVLGTLSGTSPGLPWEGFLLPLNVDAYTFLTLTGPNQGSFMNTFGVLDANGSGAADIVLPPGSAPGLAGLTLHHAAVVFPPLSKLAFVTNAAPLTLLP